MKSEAKIIYYKKGGRNFRNLLLAHIILFANPILCIVLDWIGCWDIGVNFDAVNVLMVLFFVLLFLLSIAFFSLFIPRTKFKEIEYEGNKIAVFTNKKSLSKGTLTLYINGNETSKEYNRFVDYRWGHHRIDSAGSKVSGCLFIFTLPFIILDIVFCSKAKKEEIKREEHIVEISETINNYRISAKYNRFTKKIEIKINNNDFV